ncbi:hypothetical protein D3C73_1624700 [compost metagenome]
MFGRYDISTFRNILEAFDHIIGASNIFLKPEINPCPGLGNNPGFLARKQKIERRIEDHLHESADVKSQIE